VKPTHTRVNLAQVQPGLVRCCCPKLRPGGTEPVRAFT